MDISFYQFIIIIAAVVFIDITAVLLFLCLF